MLNSSSTKSEPIITQSTDNFLKMPSPSPKSRRKKMKMITRTISIITRILQVTSKIPITNMTSIVSSVSPTKKKILSSSKPV